MTAPSLRLTPLPGRFGIARLDPAAPLPGWADGPGFSSLSRTETELSVLCDEDRIPTDVACERGWQGLRVEGPFDFGVTGVASALTAPLAAAGVPILLISTFDTDYIFVKADRAVRAVAALRIAGHEVAD